MFSEVCSIAGFHKIWMPSIVTKVAWTYPSLKKSQCPQWPYHTKGTHGDHTIEQDSESCSCLWAVHLPINNCIIQQNCMINL
jgi:hypothetical protein